VLDAAAGGASGPPRPGVRAAPGTDPVALVWATMLTFAVLLPVWMRPGFVLSYDMVAVPQQSLEPWMWGGGEAPPRAVPQDVLVSLLDNLVPGALLQRLLLSAVLLGAGAGMAWLAASHGRVGQVAAVSAYVWSAYLYERLIIGHGGLLLAYAALPWLVAALAAARRGDPRGGPLAVVVVAMGTWVPTGGALLVAIAVPMLLWPGGAQAARARWVACTGVLAVQLTWVVPGIMTAGREATAVGMFGLDAEGFVDGVLTALGGGGIWNPRAASHGAGGPVVALTAVVVIAVLVVGLPGVRRGLGERTLTPVLAVAVVLAGWTVATAVPALDGVVAAVLGLPGGGLLRDAQKWLAPWWLVCSLAYGATAARARRAFRPSDAMRVLPYVLALLPMLLLPALAWAGLGRLTPASYPDGWQESRAALAEASDDDLVVALPWSTFRRFAWNHDRTVLDPAPRYLPRAVVTDTTLLVTGPDGRPIAVPGEDSLSARVDDALRSADPVAALREAGVGWVFVELGQPAAPGAPPAPDLSTAEEVLVADDVALYRLPGQVSPAARPSPVPAAITWGVFVAVAVGAVAALARADRRHGRRESGQRL
jgi:hypothetical protein